MQFDFDNNEILKILNDFSNSTGIIASFKFHGSRLGFTDIPESTLNVNPNRYDETHCEYFCQFLHDNGYRELCRKNDEQMMFIAEKSGKSVVYACHAGLCEAVTPVIYDGVVIGYVFCGKFVDADREYSSLEKVKEFAAEHNVDYKKLSRLYKKMPVVSLKQFNSAMSLLSNCILYIIEKKFISLKEVTVAEQVKKYIDENVSEDLRVEKLCKQFFTNRQKLHSAFRQSFGVSVKNYVIGKKLEKAENLLLTTDKSVAEVSLEVGFSDYNYFIRVFKNHKGTSPRKYRVNARSASDS